MSKAERVMENLYLKHHGVKGQKWGVRHGPPYPIEDKVMRKGTRVSTIAPNSPNPDVYKDRDRPMYIYNPSDKWDKTVYRGPFAAYKARQKRNILYQ